MKDDGHWATVVPLEGLMEVGRFETYLEIKPKNLAVGTSVEHKEK